METFHAGAFIKALRPQQWPKNILIFAPVMLGHRFGDAATMLKACTAFAAFSLTSSAIYLINDVADIDADRAHPLKRSRPVASGKVGVTPALTAAVLALAAVFAATGFLLPDLLTILVIYSTAALGYSLWLKTHLVLDVLLLTSFYVLRVFAGGVATGIRLSFWTLLFSVFLFFSLALLKRYAELRNQDGDPGAESRRAYLQADLGSVKSLGISSGMLAVLTVALYINGAEVRTLYRKPDLLWLFCPILMGWTSRLWLLVDRGGLADEDPVAFALHDRWSLLTAAVMAAVFFLAL
jgi:4-hydroxybenzoate polyprenyltransferase